MAIVNPLGAAVSTPRSGWVLLRGAIGQRRGILIRGFASACVWSAFKLSVPLLVKFAIDHGIAKNSLTTSTVIAVLIGVAGICQGVFAGVRRTYAMRLGYQVETDLRERLFNHLQRLHFSFHDQAQTGQLLSRSATDVQAVSELLFNVPITMASTVLSVAIAVILTIIQPTLAVLAMWPLLILAFMVRRFSIKVHPAALALQNELGELASVAAEAVAGVRTIKGFGAEEVVKSQMSERAMKVLTKALLTIKLRSTFAASITFLPAIGLVGVIGYGGYLVHSRQLTAGSLIAAAIFVQMLVAPLTNIGFVTAMFQRAIAACERIDQILVLSPIIVNPAHPVKLPESGSAIHFENVVFGYERANNDELDGRSSSLVLDGFSLDVPNGTSLALVGATGSGKSTIAKLLPRFYDVLSGSVSIAGVDVRQLSLSDLRRAVGIVFEDTFLLSDSIHANIAFSEPDAPFSRVLDAARLAGIHDFIETLPLKYDTELGERGLSLSGGQRQRLSIARALLRNPRILILDDATSAVDPEKELEITGALREVMAGRTTVLIAHRMATIALADRVALVGNGQVLALGTHEDLLESSEEYRHVLAPTTENAS